MKKPQKILATAVLWLAVLTVQTALWNVNAGATGIDTQNDEKTGDDAEAGEDLTLQQIKEDAVKEIEEYADIIKIKVSDEIGKKIDSVIKDYIDAIGKAKGNTNQSGLSTESSIEACVAEAKAAIDALVPAEDGTDMLTGDEPAMPSSTSDFIMVGGNWVTPTVTYGQMVNVVLPVVNMGSVNLNNVTVTPVTSNLVSEWPFEIQTSGYTQTIPDLPGKGNGQSDMDRRRELTWTLKARTDALSGYYKLQFNVLYYVGTEVESATLTTYVKVNGAPGSGNVESEGGGTSTPRVIITGYETNPEKVNAGDTFTLTLHLKNTSKRTAVSNMLVNLAASSEGSDVDSTYAAFLPTSGSNTEYITTIGKGETVDLSIEMTAKADLTQKPYQIDVNMEYEDEDYASFTSTADVSIPIYQNARFELSTPEILPESITVGTDANIMFSIYNVGKTTLYNTKVSFEGDSVTGGEVFLGKIEAGGTGSVDSLVTGAAATEDDGTVKIVVSYEDESGNKSTYEQDITLMVTEDSMGMGDEMLYEDMMMDGDLEEEESSGLGGIFVIVIVVVVVLVIVGIVVVVLVRKSKKKKAQQEELDLLDDFDEEEDLAGSDDEKEEKEDTEDEVEDEEAADEGEDESDEIS